MIQGKDGNQSKISIFESPMDFCYVYGKSGHGIKDYSEKEGNVNLDDETNLSFRPWLRAPPVKKLPGKATTDETKPRDH